jgi:hypothetical protein
MGRRIDYGRATRRVTSWLCSNFNGTGKKESNTERRCIPAGRWCSKVRTTLTAPVGAVVRLVRGGGGAIHCRSATTAGPSVVLVGRASVPVCGAATVERGRMAPGLETQPSDTRPERCSCAEPACVEKGMIGSYAGLGERLSVAIPTEAPAAARSGEGRASSSTTSTPEEPAADSGRREVRALIHVVQVQGQTVRWLAVRNLRLVRSASDP